jgi:dCMP deaminase
MNAIAQAARHGVSIDGATAYVTNMPCTTCAKALLAAGIKRVVIFSDYHGSLAEKFLEESGVPLDRLPMPGREIAYDLDDYPSASKF